MYRRNKKFNSEIVLDIGNKISNFRKSECGMSGVIINFIVKKHSAIIIS